MLQEHQTIILTFSMGLFSGLIATYFFSKTILQEKQQTQWKKQYESLKNIQSLVDELSKKTPINNTSTNNANTITKEAAPISPIPHCAIIMQGSSLDGYVIPYTIEGESVYHSSTKQGLAFRQALRTLKQRGHNFNVLKPRGTLGNYISKDRTKNTKFDPYNQFEFPINLMSNN